MNTTIDYTNEAIFNYTKVINEKPYILNTSVGNKVVIIPTTIEPVSADTWQHSYSINLPSHPHPTSQFMLKKETYGALISKKEMLDNGSLNRFLIEFIERLSCGTNSLKAMWKKEEGQITPINSIMAFSPLILIGKPKHYIIIHSPWSIESFENEMIQIKIRLSTTKGYKQDGNIVENMVDTMKLEPYYKEEDMEKGITKYIAIYKSIPNISYPKNYHDYAYTSYFNTTVYPITDVHI